ncbi:unnamed protein product [Brassica rapa]|uniref:Uncharacterized protein n=2 Tax=Brassica TaxID=3705 RepID=A0A3P5YLA1_BRACM|nr:unnamed protein product [Brassica rapa]VDC60828.1 unnamed protein product [Brassica rapa]
MACSIGGPSGSRTSYGPWHACGDDIRAIPWMLWTIWKNRNSLIYAEFQVSHSLLVQTALEEETLWHELNRVESSGITMPNDLGVPK